MAFLRGALFLLIAGLFSLSLAAVTPEESTVLAGYQSLETAVRTSIHELPYDLISSVRAPRKRPNNRKPKKTIAKPPRKPKKSKKPRTPSAPADTNPPAFVINFITKPTSSRVPGKLVKNPDGFPAQIIQDTRNGLTFTRWMFATLNIHNIRTRGGKNGKNFGGSDTKSSPILKFRDAMGLPGDQAGHIIANILGFTGRKTWNIFPTSGKLNNGAMKSAESQIRKVIEAQKGGNVKVYVRMLYNGNYPAFRQKQVTRPNRIYILAQFGNNQNMYWDLPN